MLASLAGRWEVQGWERKVRGEVGSDERRGSMTVYMRGRATVDEVRPTRRPVSKRETVKMKVKTSECAAEVVVDSQ
jgi:hypothetical protein